MKKESIIFIIGLILILSMNIISAACTDSDGGIKPLIKGGVVTDSGTFTDSCEANNTLREYSCASATSNTPMSLKIKCINLGGKVCSNGACASPPINTCANINCNDNNACTDDSCSNGNCVNTPKTCPDGQSCSEGNCVSMNPPSQTSSPINCIPNWQCTSWSTNCVNDIIARTCSELNNCGTDGGKPAESQYNYYCKNKCYGQDLSNIDYYKSTGINYKVSNTWFAKSGSENDKCLNEVVLRKFYCDYDSVYNYKEYICPNGCSQGACIKENILTLQVLTLPAMHSNTIPTGPTTALLVGQLTALQSGQMANAHVWFELGKTTSYDMVTPVKTITSLQGEGIFGVFVSDLTPETTYHYRAVAANDIKTVYGQDLTFTTPTGPTTETEPSPIYGNIECYGQTSKDIDYYTQGILRWRESYANQYPQNIWGIKTDKCINNNILKKYYCYSAISFNQQVYKFNDFNCPNGCKDGACVRIRDTFGLNTNPGTSITTNSATLNGAMTNLAGNSNVDVWFEGGTLGSEHSYVMVTWSNLGRKTINSPGSFNVEVSGLKPLTTYYYRAVAASNSKIEYGIWKTFTTIPVPDNGVTTPTNIGIGENAVEPWPFLSTDIFQVTTWTSGFLNPKSNVLKPTSARLAGTYFVNTLEGVLPGVPKVYCWFEIGETTSYGRETTKQEFNERELGRYYSEDVTGLSPSTTYHFRAVASAEGYGTVYGPDKIFTTPTWTEYTLGKFFG